MVVEVEATEEEDQGDANGEAGDGEGDANAEASDASAGTRLVSAESSLAPFRARKVKRPMPEPTHLIEDECAKTAALRVFAVADDAKYECSTNAIAFKPTVMFQARTHSVVVKNVSAATLPFEWTVCDDAAVREGRPARPSPFEVSPATGSILPGSEATLTVRFAPRAVVDCSARFGRVSGGRSRPGSVEISLDGAAPALRTSSSAVAITSHGGRRPARARARNANGEGSRRPRDARRGVSEPGTGTRHARRFLVLNPTSASYAFRWADRGAGRPAGDRAGFGCVTPDGTIGAGSGSRWCLSTPRARREPSAPTRRFPGLASTSATSRCRFVRRRRRRASRRVRRPRGQLREGPRRAQAQGDGRAHEPRAIPFPPRSTGSRAVKLLRFEPSSGMRARRPDSGDVRRRLGRQARQLQRASSSRGNRGHR